jgi:N-methylhydantoinase B/oxoprolinase/acetone carboxylase alpha subunit
VLNAELDTSAYEMACLLISVASRATTSFRSLWPVRSVLLETAAGATRLPCRVCCWVTNTQNTPIEALERTYPMRVRRYRLRQRSGGAGEAPGGDGIERDLQVLEDCTVSLITERRVSRPPGLWGGEPGAPGETWVLPGGDESQAKRLPDKCTIRLRTGDVLRMLTPGGGGWGPPRHSSPD